MFVNRYLQVGVVGRFVFPIFGESAEFYFNVSFAFVKAEVVNVIWAK